MHTIITGFHRGGLGYVKDVLCKNNLDAGFDYCGVRSLEDVEAVNPRHAVQVSPDILPFIDSPIFKGLHKVFILRDPMKVLNSLYYLGEFHDEKQSNAAELYYQSKDEQAFKGKPANAICRYLSYYWSMAKKCNKLHRVEEPVWLLLANVTDNLQGQISAPAVSRLDINASSTLYSLKPSDLPEERQEEMKNILLSTGYAQVLWYPKGGHAHYVNPDWHY